MFSLNSIMDINVLDILYHDYMSDPNLFVLECLKYVHKSVDENLSSIEECKKIVYEYDVIEVLDLWEGQAECSRNEFAEKPTYLDFVFVPIFLDLFNILEIKFSISFEKDIHTGHISMNNEEIPWYCIYIRNCFKNE